MPRDPAATRDRILRAGIVEFAAYGLAGGRVDRITRAAHANPRSLYVYFGSKEGLFDAAVTTVLAELGATVPLTVDDLPGWAGRTFDWIVAHPEAVRLNLWRTLERPSAGPDDRDRYGEAITALARRTGPGAALPAPDLLVLVANMAAAWVSTSQDLLTADGSAPADPARLAVHRTALVAAVTRLTA